MAINYSSFRHFSFARYYLKKIERYYLKQSKKNVIEIQDDIIFTLNLTKAPGCEILINKPSLRRLYKTIFDTCKNNCVKTLLLANAPIVNNDVIISFGDTNTLKNRCVLHKDYKKIIDAFIKINAIKLNGTYNT